MITHKLIEILLCRVIRANAGRTDETSPSLGRENLQDQLGKERIEVDVADAGERIMSVFGVDKRACPFAHRHRRVEVGEKLSFGGTARRQLGNELVALARVLRLGNVGIASREEFLRLDLDAIPWRICKNHVKAALVKDARKNERPVERLGVRTNLGATGKRLVCRLSQRGVFAKRPKLCRIGIIERRIALGQEECRRIEIGRRPETPRVRLGTQRGKCGTLRLDLGHGSLWQCFKRLTLDDKRGIRLDKERGRKRVLLQILERGGILGLQVLDELLVVFTDRIKSLARNARVELLET